MEECTSADTGVGAAIASGSHLQKGNWALFVMAAIVSSLTQSQEQFRSKMCQVPLCARIAILRIMATSPRRLVSAVASPAPAA